MIIWVYDRWGNQKDCLYDIIDFSHSDDINKVESIEFSVIGSPVEKGDYLVWRDEFLVWHEDIVASCEVKHQGIILQHIYAEDSLVELALSYINERDSYNMSNSVGLTRCIENTRWMTGTVSALGIGDIKFYHQSVYQGIVDLQEIFGGEISTTKMVNSTGVYQRRINWQSQRGSDYGLIFTYGYDADGIERCVELDNVYTRVHVFGKGEPSYGDDGAQTGYGRRLTFADINGGRDYVEDNDALTRWGVIGKTGTKVHSEGSVIFDQCEDPNELLSLGYSYLAEVSKPRVLYKANVVILADAGMDYKNVVAGDTVYIRDEILDERLTGRIMQVKRFVGGSKPTEVTLGNVIRTVGNVLQNQQSQIDSLLNRSSSWDGAAGSDRDWLKNVMDTLNDEINATGGYVYWDYGEGITVYDKPKNENPTMVIQLKGGSLRIANSKKSNGDWDWRTFGTGNGFIADEIVAGVLRGGNAYFDLNTGEIHFNHGGIYDAVGKNFWNLDTGELSMSTDSVWLGDKTIGQYFEGIQSEIADVDKAMDDLDSELRKAMEDGMVTEAEAAAIAKMLQRVQAEQVEAIAAYNSVYGNSLLKGTAKSTLYNAKYYLYGTSGEAGTYGSLVSAINNVINATTASQLNARMVTYNTYYKTYTTRREAFNSALKAAETYITNAYADATAYDEAKAAVDSQTQLSIFNKLTNNGATQGIYLQNGKVYINASYIKSGTIDANIISGGIIQDRYGYNSWNLNTGVLTITRGSFRCGFTTGSSPNIYLLDGKMYGYQGTQQVGYIDYSAAAYNINNPNEIWRGIQIQGGMLRISTSVIAVANSSSVNTTTTNAGTGQTGFVVSISDRGNGSIGWSSSTLTFTNGLATGFPGSYSSPGSSSGGSSGGGSGNGPVLGG